MNTHKQYFSEWSTVCLIRRISECEVKANCFNSKGDYEGETFIFDGALVFADETEKETLSNYRIKLRDSQNNLIADSGICYSNNYNDINRIYYDDNKHRLRW
mgnify:CR=1 FL=1